MRPTPLPTILLLVAVSGCGRQATEPATVLSGSSAVLVATHPVARSVSVAYDTDIWGQFDRPLTAATVTAQSVYLKLDGQRVPSTVTYEAATQRIRVRPTPALELRRTYTVEFTPSVHDADGTPLPPGIFFQFTTNSLRRLVYDYPARDAIEGPVVTLGWGGGQIPLNELFYEVYASDDSLAVAHRTVAHLQRSVFVRFVPRVPWPAGTRVYWAITSENLLTQERMEGPVQSFRVLDASVPVEEMSIGVRDFGSKDIRSVTQYCNRPTLPCGPSYNAAIHWNYTTLPPDARVVGATMSLTKLDIFAGAIGPTGVGVWMSQTDWTACAIGAPGPPYTELDGLLSTGTAVTPIQIDFSSARLAGFVEALARRRTFLDGVVMRSPGDVQFHSPLASDGTRQPKLIVRFQRLPPSPPS